MINYKFSSCDVFFFFFNDTATTEIYTVMNTLSLHDALPISGGIPNLADFVTREAYSHECISVGWWPGGGFAPILEPAFYAYAYPEPPGCPDAVIAPVSASYNMAMHEWILPYEAVRRAPDPDAALLEFAQSTYAAAADLGGWARTVLER